VPVGFDVFLRTGELFALMSWCVSSRKEKPVLAADEVVIVESKLVVTLVKLACEGKPKGTPILTMRPEEARKLLKALPSS